MRRFLALGDSYTIGEGVAAGERWPAQLAARLRAEGAPVGDPEIVAVTGWTTDELAAGIDQAAPQGAYDLVTLLVGVNDQYRHRALHTYEAGFATLLERAIVFAGGEPGRTVVLSIPDWGVSPFAAGRDRGEISRHIDTFNAAARRIAFARGAAWVDVTASSRATGSAPEAYVSDGLHPSAGVYAEWAALVLPAALAALGNTDAGVSR